MSVDLRLDEDKIDEEDYKVVLHVFVCKVLASRALGEADGTACFPVIGCLGGRVEDWDRVGAFDADFAHR